MLASSAALEAGADVHHPAFTGSSVPLHPGHAAGLHRIDVIPWCHGVRLRPWAGLPMVRLLATAPAGGIQACVHPASASQSGNAYFGEQALFAGGQPLCPISRVRITAVHPASLRKPALTLT